MTNANFCFTHWMEEIKIKKYSSNKQLISSSFPYEIYQRSDSRLIHLSKKSPKIFEKNFFYSKKAVSDNGNMDRRTHNSNTARYIIDDNINDSTDKITNVIRTNTTYRITLNIFLQPWKN